MTPERWQEVERIYHSALEREESQRAAYLQKICAGDDELREEIETLLAQQTQSHGILESPTIEGVAGLLVSPPGCVHIGQQLGCYKILSLLGAGGMGEVYQARDTKLGRDVAIKVLPAAFVNDAERVARLQREARLLASLNHPNIAIIYGLEQFDGAHYLVMELVSGKTLAERISKGALPMNQALNLAGQIAEALEAAHEKGVIHRDLKPANMKVTPEGRVKVLDFGLAKAFTGDGGQDLSQAPTLSEEGKILGTPAYMSPDQARGLPVDKRTDIWAFGCVFYEMLTGRTPFAGHTVSDTLAAVLEREPDWSRLPEAVPVSIRRLLQRCLEKTPSAACVTSAMAASNSKKQPNRSKKHQKLLRRTLVDGRSRGSRPPPSSRSLC
jgi:serine/threonine protein kinase